MISPGTILINKDVPRPKCFELEDNSPSDEWGVLKNKLSRRERENELTRTGWTFFFMTNLQAKAFGFDQARTTAAALKRFIAKVKLQRCNCLEIDHVEARSFLGILYVCLSGHARHIQPGMAFSGN